MGLNKVDKYYNEGEDNSSDRIRDTLEEMTCEAEITVTLI